MLPESNFPVTPDKFIGRKEQIEAFHMALQHGVIAGRTNSFAILGDWGIGKSSLLLRFAAICSEPRHKMLPVFLSVSEDIRDYLRLAESLLDKMAGRLATANPIVSRLSAGIRNWKPKKVSIGGFDVDREAPQFFLSTGTALLRHVLGDAWKHFFRPAHLNGAIFFLDDLHNFAGPGAEGIALTLRDQFQAFGIEGMNYSVCFSARADYFSDIRSLAEPAVRFYEKLYLAPFTLEETSDYVQVVFAVGTKSLQLSQWLYERTLGHPYFLAFICRQLAASAQGSPLKNPEHLWPQIFQRLEREKFRVDLSQAAEKEIELLRQLAAAVADEASPGDFDQRFERIYFRRLTEKGLLIRTGRGRYRLYHPLFKLFLQGLKP